MDLEAISPRVAAGVGLLALLPAVWYAFGRPSVAGFVAAVNVIIIFAALWVGMQPVDSENGLHGDGSHGNGNGSSA